MMTLPPVRPRLRIKDRSDTIESLLSFFSDKSSNRLLSSRSRHQSTLTPYLFRLECLLTFSHVLVQHRSMLQTGGVTSQVDTTTTGLVAMDLLVRVVVVHLVLYAQMMRMMVDRMMMTMMSDHRC
jgi:hypothetical protein